jgi:putative methionine-R-sulfoxide reductase with GAF domain
MPRFFIHVSGRPKVRVESSNWLSALGEGLDELGVVARIDGLACEVYPNGKVVARDVRTGTGFIVEPEAQPEDPMVEFDDEFDDDPETLEAPFIELLDQDPETAEEGVRLAGLDDEAGLEMPPHLMNRINDVRTAPGDLPAWQVALDVSHELVPAEAGAGVVQLDTRDLLFAAASGPHGDELSAVKLPAGTGIVGFCIDRNLAIIIRDAKRDPRFYSKVDEETGFATQSVLCVPVSSGDRVHGCLELLNPPPDEPFTTLHMAMLHLVAETIAERLQNSPPMQDPGAPSLL